MQLCLPAGLCSLQRRPPLAHTDQDLRSVFAISFAKDECRCALVRARNRQHSREFLADAESSTLVRDHVDAHGLQKKN